MHIQRLNDWQHSHRFNTDDTYGERNTKRVIWLTFFMMIIEISAGYLYGSMALLADGWHMGTHAVALGITVFAYYYARRHLKFFNLSQPQRFLARLCYLVSIHKWSFCPISASICVIACVGYHGPPPRNSLISLTLDKNPQL